MKPIRDRLIFPQRLHVTVRSVVVLRTVPVFPSSPIIFHIGPSRGVKGSGTEEIDQRVACLQVKEAYRFDLKKRKHFILEKNSPENCSLTQRNDVHIATRQSPDTRGSCELSRFLKTVYCDGRDQLCLSYTGCTCSLSRSGQRPRCVSSLCKLSDPLLPLQCPCSTLVSIRSVLYRFLSTRERRC